MRRALLLRQATVKLKRNAFQGIPLWKVLRRFDFQGQQRALNLLFPESRLCAQFDKAAPHLGLCHIWALEEIARLRLLAMQLG